MKRFLKWIGYSLMAILVLLLVVFIVASVYVKQHKQALIKEASASIEKKYHSVVTIKDIHLSLLAQFPNLSIQLEEIDVKGPMYAVHHQKLFAAEKMSIRIKTFPLFLGKINFSKTKINNGQLFIYTDSLGRHNLDEFKQKNKAKQNNDLPIPEKIELNNFNVIIKDDQKLKLFQFDIKQLEVQTQQSNTNALFEIDSEIRIKNLIFNHAKGSFVKDQLLKGNYTIVYDKLKKAITAKNLLLTIGSIPFNINADFDLRKDGRFRLNIQTNQVPFTVAQSFLTKNINRVLKLITITQPLTINTVIRGPLSGGEPHVVANWETKQTTIGTKQIQFTNATVKGTFNNQVDSTLDPMDANSSITLNQLQGNWHSIPIQTSNIAIHNLTYPSIKGGFNTQFDLSKLNPPLNTDNLIIKNGTGKINLQYQGPLSNISEKNTKLSAHLQIDNATLYLKPIDKDIIHTHADIEIKNNNIEIKKLSAQTKEGSQLNVTGYSTNSLAAIPNTPGKANIVININSPYLDLNNFSAVLQKSYAKKKPSKQNTFSKIDHILENETIHINIDAKQIKWQKLVASNMKSSIDLNTGNWHLNNLSMNIGGGTIQLSTRMVGNQNKKSITALYRVNQVRANDLLYGMNNFGLAGLSHQNIRGELTMNGQLTSPLNSSGNILPNQIKAQFVFQLNKGALLNYEPLIKIQEKIFQKRHLDSLQFASIQNNITIQNGNIHIPRMEIATSALNLFVGGDYGLNGKTNLHIQVPLNNFTQKDQSKKMKTASNKDRGGTSVFLKAVSDASGKIKLTLDGKGGQYKREQIGQ